MTTSMGGGLFQTMKRAAQHQGEAGDPPMTLTLRPVLHSAGVEPAEALVIRNAYVREYGDTGMQGLHADSTDDEILRYTDQQSAKS
jgi:hypothetical protein